MTQAPHTTVTRLLQKLQGGDRSVFDDLFARVYEEMHAQAHHQRKRWHRDYTLNTTALVHEAYLKLVDQTQAEWNSRAHFLSVASKAMRHILIDYARRRRAQKRGGDQPKLSLGAMEGAVQDKLALSEERAATLLSLDEALDRLAQLSERQSRIVECRFFGGMTVEETATALEISPATVKRGWTAAQAWLQREFAPSPDKKKNM